MKVTAGIKKIPLAENNGHKISLFRVLAFAAPAFASSLIHGPMAGILPALIVKNYNVELAVMSSILLVSRIFDGFSDPLVGYFSDRTRTRIGRRKPWIIVGTVIMMAGVYGIFIPPSGSGALYFMIWFLLITFGWTCSEVPYSAWIAEITRDYNERNRIQMYRQSFALIAAFIFYILPLLPIFPSNEMTTEVLKFTGIIILITLPPAVAASLMLNREGENVSVREALSVRDLLVSVKRNRPFQIYVLIFICNGLAIGMTAVLFFPVIDAFLGLGDKISFIMVSSVIIAFISLPVWNKVISYIGKHRAMTVSGLMSIAAFCFFLSITPGPESFKPFLIVICVSQIAFGAYLVVPVPMMADVIDYDILKTGTNRAGQYFSVLTLLTKSVAAFGGALAYYILSLFGFDISAKVHSPTEVTGLYTAFIYIPMSIAFIGSILAWVFPIDKRRQTIIKKRIERRAIRIKNTEL